MKRFFKPKKHISFNEYLEMTLITARRISEVSPGKQRYSSAQFEMALIAFGDFNRLKLEMDDDIEVELPKEVECDWIAGFDWLDLAVSYGDEDAISYFKSNLQKKNFSTFYFEYKAEYRPDCALQSHEDMSKHQRLKL